MEARSALQARTACLCGLSVLLAALVTFVPSSHSADAAECTISDKLVNSCRPWLGAESGGYGVTGFRASMLEHEARIGRQLDVVHEYLQPGDLPSSDVFTLARRPGTIALVNWRVADKWADADGRSATVNTRIDAMADSIKSLGSTKIMLAVFHEPENDISPGTQPTCPGRSYTGSSGAVAQYVDMWHNVRARFDAKGVSNVVWVMNYMGWEGWNCVVDALWPGNSYVDWVTWDPYPRNVGWDYHVGGFYNFLTAHSNATHDYLSKPWGLSEFGCVGSTQALAYQMYDDAKRALDNNTYPKIKLYTVWDQHTSSSTDNRVAYTRTGVRDPVEQAHYNAFANDPLISGSSSPSQDTTAPSVPEGLAASSSSSGVRLTWSPSTDNVGVAGYTVNRGGTDVGSTAGTTFTDTTAPIGQQVSYTVTAYDAAGNRSDPSDSVTATRTTTTSDTVKPTAPTGLTAVAGTRQVTLHWTAATDNVGVAQYYVFRDTHKLALLGNVTDYTDTGLVTGTRYVYKVYAIDAAGNWSGPSNQVGATAR